ncbi:MAG: nucleotidyltransferase family protein [Deltaproteobacteria bacterium]|nr:nucleotidyltransferase family protein [Deltaproteobacteria bacterium]
MQKTDNTHIKRISAIVLAAGQSKRMGRAKQLLPFGSGTVLETVIDSLTESKVDETILVLGYRGEEIRKSLSCRPSKTVFNQCYEEGMSTSIICGMNAADERADAVMIVLGDQPLISSEVIDRLAHKYRNGEKGIVVPLCKTRRGNPVIFDMKYREKLLALCGDIGGKGIIDSEIGDVMEVDIESDAIILDIDEKDDYLCHLEKIRA